MIELNLLPEELRKKKKRIELPEIPLIPIAIGVVGVLVIVQVLLSGLMLLGKKQMARLDSEWKELAPQKTALDKIKAEITATGKKTQAIEGLMEGQLNWARLLNELSNSLTGNIWLAEVKYDEKVETRTIKPAAPAAPSGSPIAKIQRRRPAEMPKQAAISKNYNVRTLTVSGFAAGKGEEATTVVARFIRALKDNRDFFRDFDDIELVSMKHGFVAEEDIMNFTLACRFKLQEVGG